MNRFYAIIGLAAMLGATQSNAAPPIPDVDNQLDADLTVLLMKEKARQNILSDAQRQEYAERGYLNDDGCGNLTINSDNREGNVVGNVMGRGNTTIITGPVINAANCR